MDIEDWSLEADGAQGVTGRVDLPGVEGGLVLRFDARAAMPSPTQVQAVQELMTGWPALRGALTTSLFAWWSAASLLDKDVPPPPDAPDDVWDAVWLNEIQVPALAAKGSRLVRVLGECDWLREAGLEIGVRNAAELLYVGPADGKGLREPRHSSPWNYADPAVRDAALAGNPVDEDAFDDARPAQAGASAARRPWWKPW